MVSDPKACTQIGCSDGLMVRIDDAPAGLVRVELLPSGETGPRYVVECAAAQGCAGGAWFPGFTGDYAVVRVTTSEGTFSWEVRPVYSVTQPNGLDCPPICRNASVTVSMNW